MNVTVDLTDLRRVLTTAKKIAGGRYALPAMEGVRLDADTDELRVTATNYDMTYSTTIPATVYERGAVLVSCKGLAGLVKGKGSLNLAADVPVLHVVNGVESVLPLLPLDEFPATVEAEWADAGSLALSEVSQVIVAASRDDARPILTGVLVRGADVVATDSYRLHLHRYAEGTRADLPGVLIPSAALVLAAKLGPDAGIEYGRAGGAEPTHVRITVGAHTFVVRLIDGDFPNYNQLIPVDQPYSLTVDRDSFARVLAGVGQVVARTASPIVLTVEGSELVVSTKDRETERTSSGRVPCKATDGYPVTAYNPAFLVDAVATMTGEKVALRCSDSLKPVLLSEERETGTAIRLIMPVRIA